MARPRVFISSTYYDLKHLRSSIENFVENLGFDPVLSEKGDIAYSPDMPLDESCYREARNADIYVLIVGGRYGSEASRDKSKLPKDFYSRYESITKLEYKSASENDIPIYILIEKSVYADFENFLKNKTNITFNYAHVDSINIFHFIEEILTQTRNNPIYQFDRYGDIENWLREQWAGLFRELLKKLSSQSQMASLSSQVSELSEINQTLKRYLETLMTKVVPTDSSKIIESESQRLIEARKLLELKNNRLVEYLIKRYLFDITDVIQALSEGKTFVEFLDKLISIKPTEELKDRFNRWKEISPKDVEADYFEAKAILNLQMKTPTKRTKKTTKKSKN